MSNIVNYRKYLESGKSRLPDPLAIIHWLRENKGLAPPYYLHLDNRACAEIGWKAKEHISLLDGQSLGSEEWASAVRQIGDRAAALGSKAFGYLGFDAYDSSQGFAPDKSLTFPLLQFFIPEHRIHINADRIEYIGPDTSLSEKISHLPPSPVSSALKLRLSVPDKQFPEQAFMDAVAAATTFLSDESITKVVLSRYMRFDYDADLPALFSAYCLQQQYSDAVLMDFGTVGAAIASPESLIQSDSGLISVNPLAGTRVCGSNEVENRRIAKALLNDRKELAEHTLALLHMMRELEPFCEPGTLAVKSLLDVIRQNNIMHLSSELTARLGADSHCIDAMLSLFPSAMVSGVPKAESIRLIRRLEPFPRGLFAGTAGWVSGSDCRFALTIRGIYKYGSSLFVQAGAGIMAESNPVRENEEVLLKMSSVLNVLSGRQYN